MKLFCKIILFSTFIAFVSCTKTEETLFESVPASETGIDFINRSLEKKDFNIFNYRNFYNGGGVAIGDVNNDGFADVFVTSNFEENRLYLNKGNADGVSFKFEDITKKVGIVEKKFWSTGATFADVNGDGLMDIYICNSGSRDERGNQLYINQGIKNGTPTFKEQAKEYGLVDGGLSTHAAFFDYDRDGDLDMYLLNNSFTPIDKLGYTNLRNERDKLGGAKLFRNDIDQNAKNGKTYFTDVSAEAGIYGSLIGFGLGITIGDVNNDNWLDIYVSNDFYERDYLYINQKNGTFKEDIKNQMQHISLSSMGADVADINNDGQADIFVTDMLPGDDIRLKTTSTNESYELFDFKLKQDYWYQYQRNMLHLNNGDGTFSEVAQMANVHATDWSWGALIFDMDNDGNKDLFVANGVAKDLTDQDFVNYMGDRNTMQEMLNGKQFNYKDMVDKISSKPIPNYAFQNKGDLKFQNVAKNWGLEGPGFSNGSAYGDLDNDGDLDLIVNNLNAPLSVFRNKTNEISENKYLKINLKGSGKNPFGVGTKVAIYREKEVLFQQQMPNRGFQSSSDNQLVFGLGMSDKIDSLVVTWSDDKQQVVKKVQTNTTLTFKQSDAVIVEAAKSIIESPLFTDITSKTLDYKHIENDFVDYNRDVLLKQKYSTQGPAMTVGDVNGDKLDDIYLGGAAGQAKHLFLQNINGKFIEKTQPDFGMDMTTENVDAIFFDADKDSDLDLFVVTGSNEFMPDAAELHDVLYLNDGKGNFKRDTRFPSIFENGSCAEACDFDKDGDMDLFVGSRMISGKYGYNPASYLYINDGTGGFKNYTKRYIPDISSLGMVTDATWADIDKDGFTDLIITQDWGGIAIFKNEKGRKLTLTKGIENSEGLWNTIKASDLDNDGDIDFVVGNVGENVRLKATIEKPANLYANDFDRNGTTELLYTCFTENGKAYPMVLKGELQRAIPMIKGKFVKFSDYAGKEINQVFSEEQLKDCITKKAVTLKTGLLINDGKGNFTMKELPAVCQYSTVNAIETADFDGDNKIDILLAGNFYDVLPEWGRSDANYGIYLKGNGKGDFSVIPSKKSGFFTIGQVRKMLKINQGSKNAIVVAKNNDKTQVFSINKK